MEPIEPIKGELTDIGTDSGITTDQLKYMLLLLDDEDPFVVARVSKALMDFGTSLESIIKRRPVPLNISQTNKLKNILETIRQEHFTEIWLDWLKEKDDTLALEKAFVTLAYLEMGDAGLELPVILDQLAAKLKCICSSLDAAAVMDFLFQQTGISGAKDDYYNPLNLNLVYVINEKKGVPLTLGTLAILTAQRLDITLHGLRAPGHFLVADLEGPEAVLYNCFTGGGALSELEMGQLKNAAEKEDIKSITQPASTREIILMVIGEMVTACKKNGDKTRMDFYTSLYAELQHIIEG